jgi:predicted metal-dependent peptidase
VPRSRRGPERVNEEWLAGFGLVYYDRLFGKIVQTPHVVNARDDTRILSGEWAAVTSNGVILCNTRIRGSAGEWAYAIAHCLLHLCLDHFREHQDARAWNLACDLQVGRFLDGVRFGVQPLAYHYSVSALGGDEEAVYRELTMRRAVPADYRSDLVFERQRRPNAFPERFAIALRKAVTEAVRIAGGVDPAAAWREAAPGSIAAQAQAWFVAHYPLLGAVATSFEVIEDVDACRALDVSVAAVWPAEKRIIINPLAGLSLEEMKFVMAHEILHAALRHEQRVEGRDFFLWNCAADFVINLWLVEMGVGEKPFGLLYDPALKGLSAESVYDRITRDLRLRRRLLKSVTFAGRGRPDMIEPRSVDWWERGRGVDLDAFYRSALAQGLELHGTQERGLLPAGLVEEIQAQALPPIPWEVKLAQWLDQFFPTPEYRRSYARPSRRQAATPEIPRPRVVLQEGWDEARTFGVVIDTSGSMDRITLARGLGAVASYCVSREIPAVRVVFCDAAAYDQGYMSAEDVAGRVRVRGRGGTELQPGVDLLQGAGDFPDEGPILVITDTFCEPTLRVRREHAYLVPFGRRLPFPPRGPVFTMPPSKLE